MDAQPPLARQAASARQHPLNTLIKDRAEAELHRTLGTEESLQVQSVQVDPNGDNHWRMSHHFRGLRVVGSYVAHHANPQGETLENAPALLGSVPLLFDTTPVLTAADARALVKTRHGALGHLTTELVIRPETRLVFKQSGQPYQGEAGAWNTDDFRRDVSGYRLAWCVEGEEPIPGRRGSRAMRTYLDARTGEPIQRHSLEGSDTPTEVTGNSSYYWPNQYDLVYRHLVKLDANIDSSGRVQLIDDIRKFKVMDDDCSDGSGPNVATSTSTTWGDAKAFMGDATATTSNRRTHMVNVKYGLQAVWDMFSHVFNRKGPDNDYYSVHGYVHVDDGWSDAHYRAISGNISFGDGGGPGGEWLTAVDTVAHEWGHAVCDFTAGLDWDGAGTESAALNEGNSDIVGALTRMYVYNRDLDASYGPNPFITDNGSDAPPSMPFPDGSRIDYWKLAGGRRFRNPTAPAWYPGISALNEHVGLGPLCRAFYFMVRGASSSPTSSAYSPLLPNGSTGMGANKAAKIYIDAFTKRFTGSEDYSMARTDILASASALYGSGSKEVAIVKNAFAGVGVGSVDSGYVFPTMVNETSSTHQTWATAQVISPLPGNAAGRKVITATGFTNDHDCYRIQVPYGRGLRITLVPVYFMGNWPATQMAQVFEVGDGTNLVNFTSFGVTQSTELTPVNFIPGAITEYNVNIYTSAPAMDGTSFFTFGEYKLVVDFL